MRFGELIALTWNEVDLLIKQEGELTAIEVKSSMTYSSSFEKALTQIEGWIKKM